MLNQLPLTTIAAVLLTTTAFVDPIHDAAINGDLAGVQAELDKGVNVDKRTQSTGMTSLQWVAAYGHKENSRTVNDKRCGC